MCNRGGGIGSVKSCFFAPVEGDNGPLAAMTDVLCGFALCYQTYQCAGPQARWTLHHGPDEAGPEIADARIRIRGDLCL